MIFQYGYYYDSSPFIISSVVGVIINIIVAVLINNDAKKRGMDGTIYVVLTCICGFCIGGIAYLIASSNHPHQTYASSQRSYANANPNVYGQQRSAQPRSYGQSQTYNQPKPQGYSQPQPESQNYGQSQTYNNSPASDVNTTMPNKSNMVFCSICGAENPKNAKFCSHCGAQL